MGERGRLGGGWLGLSGWVGSTTLAGGIGNHEESRRHTDGDQQALPGAVEVPRRCLNRLFASHDRRTSDMGIFSRLGTLIKSNLNDLISKAEDPQKMLNQIVVDMQNQLVEAKKQVA